MQSERVGIKSPGYQEQLAKQIACRAHAAQRDLQGRPYVEHLQRVVDLCGDDRILRAVGWLHDLLEDTDWTAERLRAEGIVEEVVVAVQLLTRPQSMSYFDYIFSLINSKNERVLHCKNADLRDHLRPDCPERLRRKYILALAELHGVGVLS